MHPIRTPRLAAATIAAGLALTAALLPASAANTQQFTAGAAMACRPALPAFDGAIRTRPLAMANEGSTAAFVTCTNWSTPFAHDNYNTLVELANRNAWGVNVNCTLVAGGDTYSLTYTPVTVSVPPNGRSNAIWGNPSAGALLPGTLRYSCALPPGVDLLSVQWGFVV